MVVAINSSKKHEFFLYLREFETYTALISFIYILAIFMFLIRNYFSVL